MKNEIIKLIQKFVKEYEVRPEISTTWGTPLVGFADATHPDILDLKKIIAPIHKLPSAIPTPASIAMAYVVPLSRGL